MKTLVSFDDWFYLYQIVRMYPESKNRVKQSGPSLGIEIDWRKVLFCPPFIKAMHFFFNFFHNWIICGAAVNQQSLSSHSAVGPKLLFEFRENWQSRDTSRQGLSRYWMARNFMTKVICSYHPISDVVLCSLYINHPVYNDKLAFLAQPNNIFDVWAKWKISGAFGEPTIWETLHAWANAQLYPSCPHLFHTRLEHIGCEWPSW